MQAGLEVLERGQKVRRAASAATRSACQCGAACCPPSAARRAACACCSRIEHVAVDACPLQALPNCLLLHFAHAELHELAGQVEQAKEVGGAAAGWAAPLAGVLLRELVMLTQPVLLAQLLLHAAPCTLHAARCTLHACPVACSAPSHTATPYTRAGIREAGAAAGAAGGRRGGRRRQQRQQQQRAQPAYARAGLAAVVPVHALPAARGRRQAGAQGGRARLAGWLLSCRRVGWWWDRRGLAARGWLLQLVPVGGAPVTALR
jgi:hypothetical protein